MFHSGANKRRNCRRTRATRRAAHTSISSRRCAPSPYITNVALFTRRDARKNNLRKLRRTTLEVHPPASAAESFAKTPRRRYTCLALVLRRLSSAPPSATVSPSPPHHPTKAIVPKPKQQLRGPNNCLIDAQLSSSCVILVAATGAAASRTFFLLVFYLPVSPPVAALAA